MSKELTHVILENKRLSEELEQRNREMAVLLAVSQSVSQSLDLQVILSSVLVKLAELMAVEAGFLYLLENGQLVLKANYGLSQQMSERMKEIALGDVARDGLSVFGEPLIVRNVRTSKKPCPVSLAKFGYQSFACIQLTVGGESIGIMGVATTIAHDFTPHEKDLLNAIGREISIAVRSIRLNEEASGARELKERDVRRAELLADVCHELRTPLAAIKGFASALLEQDVSFDEATQREFIQTIDTESDRLNILIEQLLAKSRLEAGVLELRKEWRNIRDVVSSIRDRLIVLTARRKLSIAIPDDLPSVVVDENSIGQVITNLVDNAVKYSQEGTRIILEAVAGRESVVVTIKDEGIGIPAELREKVFERFYRVKGSKTAEVRGTGLGLSVCRGIIQAHGGRIWVESKVGQGSRFRFSLPVK